MSWLTDLLPAALLEPGPRGLAWWQWLGLPAVGLLAWLAGYFLGRISRGIFLRLARHTTATWDDTVVDRLGGPLTLGWGLAAAYLLLQILGLPPSADGLADRALRAAVVVVVFWAVARTFDVVGQVLITSPWAQAHPASRSLVPLGVRVSKVGVVAFGLVALLSELGYPVASLIAGLGIGGLAVALAGQKTVENLFGAFALGADQPFREGDFVRVEDFVGTVEAIGLRSTRIRTLDRTVISIPNGRLAEMRLESFATRDRFRLACTVGLEYGSTAAQMREVVAGLERVLRAHPKIWPDAVVVRFAAFAASSLDIEVMAWFQVADYNEFGVCRQAVLLSFMQVVEEAGCSFAFPTRTVHLVQQGLPEAAAPQG